MPLTRLALILLTFLFALVSSYGQVADSNDSAPSRLRSDLQLGVVIGGQVVNEEFIYKPGVNASFSVNKEISPWIDLGLGVGIQSMEEETILPVFIDVKAHFNDKDRVFIGLNIGASKAWSTYYRNVDEFEYEGGLYFSPYYSFQFPLSDKMNLLISAGFIHMVGEIEFKTEFEGEYEERFAMDFLTIRTGIRF